MSHFKVLAERESRVERNTAGGGGTALTTMTTRKTHGTFSLCRMKTRNLNHHVNYIFSHSGSSSPHQPARTSGVGKIVETRVSHKIFHAPLVVFFVCVGEKESVEKKNIARKLREGDKLFPSYFTCVPLCFLLPKVLWMWALLFSLFFMFL